MSQITNTLDHKYNTYTAYHNEMTHQLKQIHERT